VLLSPAASHATEIGATQMSVELVHHPRDERRVRCEKILDNVIFVLVASLTRTARS